MKKKNYNEVEETYKPLSYAYFDEDGVYDEERSFFTLDEILVLRDYYHIDF